MKTICTTRDHFVYASNQWEMSLHCNVVYRRRYIVTSSLFGWVRTQNDPCIIVVLVLQLNVTLLSWYDCCWLGSSNQMIWYMKTQWLLICGFAFGIRLKSMMIYWSVTAGRVSIAMTLTCIILNRRNSEMKWPRDLTHYFDVVWYKIKKTVSNTLICDSNKYTTQLGLHDTVLYITVWKNGWHFVDDILKCVSFDEYNYILIKLWLKFVLGGIDNKSILVQVNSGAK